MTVSIIDMAVTLVGCDGRHQGEEKIHREESAESDGNSGLRGERAVLPVLARADRAYKTVKARYKTVKDRYKTVKTRFWPRL